MPRRRNLRKDHPKRPQVHRTSRPCGVRRFQQILAGGEVLPPIFAATHAGPAPAAGRLAAARSGRGLCARVRASQGVRRYERGCRQGNAALQRMSRRGPAARCRGGAARSGDRAGSAGRRPDSDTRLHSRRVPIPLRIPVSGPASVSLTNDLPRGCAAPFIFRGTDPCRRSGQFWPYSC